MVLACLYLFAYLPFFFFWGGGYLHIVFPHSEEDKLNERMVLCN